MTDIDLWCVSFTHLSATEMPMPRVLRLAKKFNTLTLYHEVSVFDSNAQYFEYINCDPKIGALRAV